MKKNEINPYANEESQEQWDTEVRAVPKPKKLTKEEKYKVKIADLKKKGYINLAKMAEKTKLKVKKARQMPLSRLKRVVQKEINHYVLLRDKDLPCISCGATTGTWNAGHYVSQGAHGALRYDLDNINKQCVGCNLYKHGNLIEYRICLDERYGEDRAEYLESKRHDIKKWTREELEEVRNNIKILTNCID